MLAPSGTPRATGFGRYVAIALISFLMMPLAPSGASSQADPGRQIDFSIPAKPLATALRDYGEASGFEVFYDGALAQGMVSARIHGQFSALDGLRELLRGTTYVPRETDIPNTLTIIPGPSVDALRVSFTRYQSYFADIQDRVSAALCLDDAAAARGTSIKFQLWLDQSGNVSTARILGRDRDIAADDRFAQRMRGLSIGKAPPHGLPQPVTMVIYPPAAGEAAGCVDHAAQRTER